MMRWLAPLGFGLVLFVVFLIAATPARFLFDMAARPAGIEAGLVQGRVWDAQILRLRSGDLRIAEARAQLAPASLLSFSPRLDITVADPSLRGSGTVRLAGGGVELEEATGVVRLDQIMPELAFFAPDEVMQFDIDTLALGREGQCRGASGTGRTAALIALGDRYGVEMPVLNFALLCAGNAVGADLAGQSDAVAFQGRLQFGAEGLEGRIEARTSLRDVIAALSFIGFEQVDQTTYTLTLPLDEEG